MRRSLFLTFLACTGFAACKSGQSTTTFGSSSGSSSGSSGGGGPTFTVTTIAAVGGAGASTAVAFNSAKLAFATLTSLPLATTNNCTIGNNFGTPVSSIQPTFDLWYGESVDGVTFTTTKVDTPMYASEAPPLSSPSLALDANGVATVAYAGGVATDEATAARRCGAALLVTRTGPSFASATALASSSQSAGKNANQDSTVQCTAQDVCDAGDITGFDPAIAFDKNNTPVFAFRDIHFGVQGDDRDKSDVEFLRGTTAEQFITADLATGGGIDNRIAILPNGKAAIAFSNVSGAEPSGPGVYVGTEKGALDWTITRVFAGSVGAHIGFAVSATGRYSLAYYDKAQKLLEYTESTDGVTWSTVADVDTSGLTGQMPSLALDPSGEPAIAYYRCNTSAKATSCDKSRDGVRVARRSNGTWQAHDASAQSSQLDGQNPALGFLKGKEVVVFQSVAFDPGSGANTVTLQVAKEN